MERRVAQRSGMKNFAISIVFSMNTADRDKQQQTIVDIYGKLPERPANFSNDEHVLTLQWEKEFEDKFLALQWALAQKKAIESFFAGYQVKLAGEISVYVYDR
jgi:hypothetical protein